MQGFPNYVSYNLLTEEIHQWVLDFLSLLSASINYDWISKSCWNLFFVPVTNFSHWMFCRADDEVKLWLCADINKAIDDYVLK